MVPWMDPDAGNVHFGRTSFRFQFRLTLRQSRHGNSEVKHAHDCSALHATEFRGGCAVKVPCFQR
jgi:hypothetical protein